jgi:hypothetical protein
LSAERKQRILDEITRHYLTSGDFNGIPVLRGLPASLLLGWEDIVGDLRELIAEERVCIIYSDTDANPHVMRLGYESAEVQIAKLETIDVHACAYPLRRQLSRVVNRSDYADRPYALCMALGEPQLTHRAFDLSVLEFYRNDPRYNYSNDDVRGHIYLGSEYAEPEGIAERDRVFLQTFGFCYDENLNRAVAVYVRYLADLSPEHQQIWKAKELEGDYRLHPDYYRNTIVGDWGEGLSVFDAFIEERQIINKMAQAMGRPPLFRDDFAEDRPREFGFLVRPTLKEFNGFVHLLDKMISDNINKEFFRSEVPSDVEEIRRDGKVVVRQKGTLTILDEWVHKRYRTDDWEPINEMIETFKEVRKKRQKPAHAIDENVFDQDYFHKQRDLMIRVYDAVRTLRLLFADHPQAGDVEVHEVLQEGIIWTY